VLPYVEIPTTHDELSVDHLCIGFFATTINYLDRQVISLLKPYLESAGLFGDDPAHFESTYANIVIAFQLSFALGMLLVGRIIDVFGTKIGYALSLFAWSIAAVGHAFAKMHSALV